MPIIIFKREKFLIKIGIKSEISTIYKHPINQSITSSALLCYMDKNTIHRTLLSNNDVIDWE